MKVIFHSLIALISLVALQAQAIKGGGFDHGNGGDMCEYRFKTVRNDFKAWIAKGGSADLNLPINISHEQYDQLMLQKMRTAKVSCVVGKVLIGEAEKTCINFVDAKGVLRIRCNKDRFMTTSEADQYVLVHHEYAGLAGFETNDGEESSYHISNQISGYLESKIIKQLVVKRSPPSFEEAFDPASCQGPQMTAQGAERLFPNEKEQSIVLAPFTLYTRERQCNEKGCGGWKSIHNQMPHPDSTNRQSMFVPREGIIDLMKSSEGIEVILTSTSRNLSGQGVYLNCDNVGQPELNCSVNALPSFDSMGEASGVMNSHCARFIFKHPGFFAGKAYYDDNYIFSNESFMSRPSLWIERQSAFVSRY